MSRRWDQHFLQMALRCAYMSKDPNTKAGAVIVGPDHEIRSTGFNGFPRGIADTMERLHNRDTKLRLIVHGEMNAVLNASRVGIPLLGCSLYLALFDDDNIWSGSPCVRCSVELIQAGIKEIVAWPPKPGPSKWHEDTSLALTLLNEAGIVYREVAFE